MGTYALTDAKLYENQYDLGQYGSQLTWTTSVQELDVTKFGATTRTRIGGLATISVNGALYYDSAASDIDDSWFTNLGGASRIVTVSPPGGTEGDVAFSAQSLLTEYSHGAAVGDALVVNVNGEGAGQHYRGWVLHDGDTSVTSSGSSTGTNNPGAVGAAEKLYAALHVTAWNATTLDVIVQSDTVGFSTPTNQVTFTQATGLTSEWATPVSGAITDTYWRVNYTLVGTSASFVVTIGIK